MSGRVSPAVGSAGLPAAAAGLAAPPAQPIGAGAPPTGTTPPNVPVSGKPPTPLMSASGKPPTPVMGASAPAPAPASGLPPPAVAGAGGRSGSAGGSAPPAAASMPPVFDAAQPAPAGLAAPAPALAAAPAAAAPVAAVPGGVAAEPKIPAVAAAPAAGAAAQPTAAAIGGNANLGNSTSDQFAASFAGGGPAALAASQAALNVSGGLNTSQPDVNFNASMVMTNNNNNLPQAAPQLRPVGAAAAAHGANESVELALRAEVKRLREENLELRRAADRARALETEAAMLRDASVWQLDEKAPIKLKQLELDNQRLRRRCAAMEERVASLEDERNRLVSAGAGAGAGLFGGGQQGGAFGAAGQDGSAGRKRDGSPGNRRGGGAGGGGGNPVEEAATGSAASHQTAFQCTNCKLKISVNNRAWQQRMDDVKKENADLKERLDAATAELQAIGSWVTHVVNIHRQYPSLAQASGASHVASLLGGANEHLSSCSSGDSFTPSTFQMPQFRPGGASDFPVVQLPAESLMCQQPVVSLADLKMPDFGKMVDRLIATRNHYQYPSLSAPQIGWNVSVFTLYDDSVWINPTLVRTYSGNSCYTWEPCASCAFLMHYIERPHECVVSYYDRAGAFHREQRLDGMRSRLVQHELDHLNGVLFTRRIPDSLHVVPMDGFQAMSDWADDYPSLEARSTNLYSLYFPPKMRFVANFLPNSELLKRHYEDNIFPGHEILRDGVAEEKRNHADLVAFIEHQKKQGLWEGSKFSRVRREKAETKTKSATSSAAPSS